MLSGFSHFMTALLTAGVTAGAIGFLWMWQAARGPRPAGPPGPLARRLGPFLDLLDARYAPLLFVATPQAYTVYAWLIADGTPAWVAILGGLGFEAVYVGAIAWAERGAGWQAARPPAITALLFSVGVAVAHYGVTSGGLAVLHIGFPLVGYAYTVMMHAKTGPRPEELQGELGELRAELERAGQERASAGREAARAWEAAGQHEKDAGHLRAENDELRATLEEQRATADHWRGLAAQAAVRPALPVDQGETLNLGGRAVAVRALVSELEAAGHKVPRSTLQRAAERAAKEG
jgi:hypothetical protein